MKTVLTIVASCAALSALAQRPQQQADPAATKARNEAVNKQIQDMIKQGTMDRGKAWGKASLTLAQIAPKIAFATKNTTGLFGMYQMLAQTSEGRGIYTGEMKFGGSGLFKVNWVRIQADPRNGIFTSDGKSRSSMLDGVLSTKLPLNQPFKGATAEPAQLVSRFSSEFPRFLFQGSTDGKDVWVPLITAWAKGANGYKTRLEERSYRYQNRDFKNFRILCERTPAAAKKMGKSKLEVVIDGYRFLPVTVREVRTDTKGKEWIVQWSGSYHFNQKFSLADFSMKGSPAKPNAKVTGSK